MSEALKNTRTAAEHEEAQKVQDFIYSIFQPNDIVWLQSSPKSKAPIYIKCLASEVQDKYVPGLELFCINPLTEKNNYRKPNGKMGLHRQNSNLARINTFAYESDVLPLPIQHELVPYLASQMSIRSIVYSGNKSIHFFIALADSLPPTNNLRDQYKQVYEQVKQMITSKMETYLIKHYPSLLESLGKKNLLDNSMNDCVKLARLGNAFREDSKAIQSVLHTGGFLLADSLKPIYNNKPPLQISTDSVIEDVREFEQYINLNCETLHVKLTHPEIWASSANNYPEIFKLTLWAIDLTGVTEPVFIEFFDKYVLQYLKSIGYPSDPYIGIRDAYRKKSQE